MEWYAYCFLYWSKELKSRAKMDSKEIGSNHKPAIDWNKKKGLFLPESYYSLIFNTV